jgi:hypothetical protein
MKKALIALALVAVMAFGAGTASAATVEPTFSVTSDPGGGVKP